MRIRRGFDLDPSCKLYLPFYKYGAEQSKIWDMSGNNNHGTISGAIPSTYPMLIPVASGSVTQANMKISAVNGTSFVDFSAANVLTDYLNDLLVIKDSAGRVIQGYIKAAGTGETLGSEILDNPTFDANTTGWSGDSATLASVSGGQSNNCLQNTRTIGGTVWSGAIDTTVTTTSSALYKLVAYAKQGTAGAVNLNFSICKSGWTLSTGLLFTAPVEWTLKSFYANTPYTAAYFWLFSKGSETQTTLWDEASLKQVLTPSPTGVTIVNQKGGSTFNWESKAPLFNYNDSSNYTYTIYSVPGQTGLGWFGDGVDDRFVHTSLNLGTVHTLHYWLLYRGLSGVIHGGAANYHGLRLTPTACGYNVGTTEVTVTHSAAYGQPVLFSIDRNGTSVDFYQNGVKIGATQTLLANNDLTVTDFLRYSDGTSYWNGFLFDAVTFNINKGAQEIRNYYELTRYIYGV